MRLKLLILAGAMAAASSVAFAQPGGGAAPSPEAQAAREAMMKACAADMKTNCDGKSGRDMMMCMRENADKLSDGCKDAMAKARAARQAASGGGQ